MLYLRMEHIFCVRCLNGNMKVARFQGKSLKDALWSCVRACTTSVFNRAFRHLKELDINAFEWLTYKHPREWSRSHFSCISHSDMLVNNICECFDCVISEARHQSSIWMPRINKAVVNEKIYVSRGTRTRWTHSICHKILDKLAMIEKHVASYRGTQCDYHLFEIEDIYGDEHDVDLQRKSCSCRKWD